MFHLKLLVCHLLYIGWCDGEDHEDWQNEEGMGGLNVDEFGLDLESTFAENVNKAFESSGEVFETDNTWFIEEVHSSEQLKEFIKPQDMDPEQIGGGVLIILRNISGQVWNDFTEIADTFSRLGIRFAYSLNMNLRKFYNVTHDWGVVVYQPPSLTDVSNTDYHRVMSAHLFDKHAIEQYIQSNWVSKVNRITYDNEEFFVYLRKLVIVCFFDMSMVSAQLTMIQAAAADVRDAIFAFTDIHAEEDYLRYYSSEILFKLQPRRTLNAVLVGARSSEGDYYRLTASTVVTKSVLVKFANDIVNGILLPIELKNQHAQAAQNIQFQDIKDEL